MVTIEQCNTAITILGIATLLIGIVTGYYFHKGENNLMFAPLVIGFVFLFAMYYFIEKKGDLIAGKKVDEE